MSDESPSPAEELPRSEIEKAEGFELPDPAVIPQPDVTPLQPAELIQVPARHNATLQRVLQAVNADEDLHAIWRCQNVNAVVRLGMSDHGPIHVRIVANSSLRVLRLLAPRRGRAERGVPALAHKRRRRGDRLPCGDPARLRNVDPPLRPRAV